MFIVQEFISEEVVFESTYWVVVLVNNVSRSSFMKSKFLGNKSLGHSIELKNYIKKTLYDPLGLK
jgi:hypothetical protein